MISCLSFLFPSETIMVPWSLYFFSIKFVAVLVTDSSVESFSETNCAVSKSCLPAVTKSRSYRTSDKLYLLPENCKYAQQSGQTLSSLWCHAYFNQSNNFFTICLIPVDNRMIAANRHVCFHRSQLICHTKLSSSPSNNCQSSYINTTVFFYKC